MTLTDIENYELALQELEELHREETTDYEKIHKLNQVIAEYEEELYR